MMRAVSHGILGVMRRRGRDVFEPSCEFSAISGIVCEGRVSGSSMSLGLDFAVSQNSFVYLEGEACPFGLEGRCMQSSDDGTVQLEMKPGFGRISNFGVKRIESLELPRDEVSLRKRIIKFRDVHGVLSMGPNSEIMHNRVVRITEKDHRDMSIRPKIKERQIEDIPGLEFVDVVDGSDGWEFLAHQLSIQGLLAASFANVALVVDPGNPDIVFPSSMFPHLENQRLQAGSPPQLVYIDIRLSGNRSLHVYVDQIGRTTQNPFIRVVVSNGTDKIILGRPFIRSLDRLYLDGVNKKLGFKMRQNNPRNMLRIPQPTVPLFGVPQPSLSITSNGDIDAILRINSHNRQTSRRLERYVLAGISHDPISHKCWIFVDSQQTHRGIDVDMSRPVSAVGGLFPSLGPLTMVRRTSDQTIFTNEDTDEARNELNVPTVHVYEFIAEPIPDFNGVQWSLFASPFDIRVCELYSLFQLPPAEKDSPQSNKDEVSNDEETPCSICLDQFKEGDLRQKLYSCQHSYHAHCLGNWLRRIPRGAKPRCPSCRSLIEQF